MAGCTKSLHAVDTAFKAELTAFASQLHAAGAASSGPFLRNSGLVANLVGVGPSQGLPWTHTALIRYWVFLDARRFT